VWSVHCSGAKERAIADWKKKKKKSGSRIEEKPARFV
jgi:hypothetical protein